MNDLNYNPSGFSQKDFRKLYKLTRDSTLRWILHGSDFRDKRIQRKIAHSSPSIKNVLLCNFDEVLTPRPVPYQSLTMTS